jgi:uncharacterized membrane protein YraQ (UPF0718 family)
VDYQQYEQFILIFTSIVWEALPFIVLGVLIGGIFEEFVPQQAVAKVIPRSRLLAIALGGLLGLVFPMCDCGIVVVMRRLLRKGLPLGVCVSYMLAGPIINVVVILSTLYAFNTPERSASIFHGPEYVALLRCGMGYIVAFNIGVLVDWLQRKNGNEALIAPNVLKGLNANLQATDEDDGPRSWRQRLSNISATSLNDFVDIMAFLIIGAALAAGIRFAVHTRDIQAPAEVVILITMGLAFLVCLCSEADAFIAAAFPATWPAASKIAFLVLGPMLDIKLVLMYTRVFRPRLILIISIAIIVQVFLLSVALHYGYEPAYAWIHDLIQTPIPTTTK